MRAGIYVRISSDAEGEGLGVKRQRADCEALAARLGWNIVDIFEDNDVSATKGKPRPEYERMRADIESGRIQGVVVWDVDRLTRTPRELEDVIDYADRVGLKLASVGGDIDLGTEQGRMMARMKGTVARYEIEQSRRRLKRKHQEMAEQGRHNGPRPFGWDLVSSPGDETGSRHKVLRLNPDEAAIIRECVQRTLDGEGLWRIVADLRARGIKTSTNQDWQTQTLRRMLLRWRNCGVRTHRGKEVGPGAWEPIIDRETHERVVATLTDPSRVSNNRGTEERYLLTGIALCGVCNRPVVGTASFTYDVKVPPLAGTTEPRTRTRHYPHTYKCPHAGCHKVQRNMHDVDEYVSAVVAGVLADQGVQIFGGDDRATADARARIEAAEAKLAIAADQFADDVITADQLLRINKRVMPQLADARHQLEASLPRGQASDFTGATGAAAWLSAPVDRRKTLLRQLAKFSGLTIHVDPIGSGKGREFHPASIRIHWKGEM